MGEYGTLSRRNLNQTPPALPARHPYLPPVSRVCFSETGAHSRASRCNISRMGPAEGAPGMGPVAPRRSSRLGVVFRAGWCSGKARRSFGRSRKHLCWPRHLNERLPFLRII